MADYHLHLKHISREKRDRSVVAAAAYRAGENLEDARADKTRYFAKRKWYIPLSLIVAPTDAPEWVFEREALWNAVERREGRKDSRLASEIEVSLPIELDVPGWEKILRELVEPYVDNGHVVDIAIHLNKPKNPHAHILITTRKVSSEGFGDISTEYYKQAWLEEQRQRWSDIQNGALEGAGLDVRVDHRSYKDRGIEKIPGKHRGPEQAALNFQESDPDMGKRLTGENQELSTPSAGADEVAAPAGRSSSPTYKFGYAPPTAAEREKYPLLIARGDYPPDSIVPAHDMNKEEIAELERYRREDWPLLFQPEQDQNTETTLDVYERGDEPEAVVHDTALPSRMDAEEVDDLIKNDLEKLRNQEPPPPPQPSFLTTAKEKTVAALRMTKRVAGDLVHTKLPEVSEARQLDPMERDAWDRREVKTLEQMRADDLLTIESMAHVVDRLKRTGNMGLKEADFAKDEAEIDARKEAYARGEVFDKRKYEAKREFEAQLRWKAKMREEAAPPDENLPVPGPTGELLSQKQLDAAQNKMIDEMETPAQPKRSYMEAVQAFREENPLPYQESSSDERSSDEAAEQTQQPNKDEMDEEEYDEQDVYDYFPDEFTKEER